MKRKNLLTLLALASSFVFQGCQSSGGYISDEVWNEADRIEYRFNDSSTPPDYHRSYSLTVTPTSASIKIDSYGKSLFEEAYDLKTDDFKNVISSLRAMNIKKKKAKDVNPCSGGTTEVLRLYENGNITFDGFQDNCEEKRSTMVVETNSIPDVLNKVFPTPIQTLVEKTRKTVEF